MFQKWADHVITAVRYEFYGPGHTWKRLAEVEVREHFDNYLGNVEMWTKQRVVTSINDNETFVTATESGGYWYKGAFVETVWANQTWYIRTVGNKTLDDNLGNLPELEPIWR